jgi:hypothetical protein
MNHIPFLLAEISGFVDTVSVQRNVLTSGLSQLSVVLLALLAVILISFIGVFVFRKQLLRRKHRHHHRKSNGVVSGRNGRDSAAPDETRMRGKGRRVRRKRRHRNPTLAETRGLPPNRDEQSMVPPSS